MSIWVFPKMVLPNNHGVFLLKLIILGCFGGTPILETPICQYDLHLMLCEYSVFHGTMVYSQPFPLSTILPTHGSSPWFLLPLACAPATWVVAVALQGDPTCWLERSPMRPAVYHHLLGNPSVGMPPTPFKDVVVKSKPLWISMLWKRSRIGWMWAKYLSRV